MRPPLCVGDPVWVTIDRFEGKIVGLAFDGKGAVKTGYVVQYQAEATGFDGKVLKQQTTGTFKRSQLEKRFA